MFGFGWNACAASNNHTNDSGTTHLVQIVGSGFGSNCSPRVEIVAAVSQVKTHRVAVAGQLVLPVVFGRVSGKAAVSAAVFLFYTEASRGPTGVQKDHQPLKTRVLSLVLNHQIVVHCCGRRETLTVSARWVENWRRHIFSEITGFVQLLWTTYE